MSILDGTRPNVTTGQHRDALLIAATTDARAQLTRARRWKVAPDFAEREWRDENPGLAALIDHAEGTS